MTVEVTLPQETDCCVPQTNLLQFICDTVRFPDGSSHKWMSVAQWHVNWGMWSATIDWKAAAFNRPFIATKSPNACQEKSSHSLTLPMKLTINVSQSFRPLKSGLWTYHDYWCSFRLAMATIYCILYRIKRRVQTTSSLEYYLRRNGIAKKLSVKDAQWFLATTERCCCLTH